MFSLDSDFEKEDVQRSLLDLEENLNECKECKDSWIVEGSVYSWYSALNDFVKQGNCKTN